jgi:nitrite reductase/ring-hydroxylating ferredoxin subunit
MTHLPTTGNVPRREMLCGLVLLGALGASGLAACTSSTTSGAQPSSSGSSSAGGAASTGAGGGGGAALAKLADIPVGGGRLVTTSDGTQVLLVQPVAGTVKGYDPHCTHQGTVIRTPVDGIMTCPRHGSEFKATDGSVTHGPAARPLKPIAVKVTGQDVTLA